MKTDPSYKCDIQGCGKQVTENQHYVLDVIFNCSQTDGYPVPTPYMDRLKLDLCEEHRRKVYKEGKYIFAYGAQGHNTYFFKDDKTIKP